MIKTCPSSYSTLGKEIFDDLSCPHGAGSLQNGHFCGLLGSPCHLTMGAPKGPSAGKTMLRTTNMPFTQDQLGALHLGEGEGAKHSPPGEN